MSNAAPPSKRSKRFEGKGQYRGPATAYVQVVQNGCFGRGRCFYLFTSTAGYLFNAPEGTERLLCEHGVRHSRLADVFFTSSCWDNLSGLNGLVISLRKSGVGRLRLHGVQGVHGMIRGAEHVSDIAGPQLKIEELDCTENAFQDDNIYVKPIDLRSKVNSAPGALSNCYGYFVRIKQKAPRLLMQKCMELRVPVGPCLGRLQAGEDVQLEDGRTVRASDVLEKLEPSPVFAVFECTDEPCVERLLELGALDQLLEGNERLNAVLHLTQSRLFASPLYKQWKAGFQSHTSHVLLSDLSSCAPHSEASFRFNVQMSHVSEQLFPVLHASTLAKFPNDKEVSAGSECILAEPWLRVNLRPNAGVVERCTTLLEPQQILAPLKTNPAVVQGLHSLQQSARKLLVDSDERYPAVTFLGTSSATPVRTRNVSALLFHLSPDSTVLCDCGESTFQQLSIRYNMAETMALLRSVQLIYISHTHADHLFGLPTFLMKRRLAFTDHGLPYEPVYLIAPEMLPRIIRLFVPYTGCLDELCIPIYTHRMHPMSKESVSALEEVKRLLRLERLLCVPVEHPMGAHGLVLTTAEGRTLVYSGDSRPCASLIAAGQGADLLVHEATMEDDLQEEARLKKHSTISEAIGVGQSMGAKFTLLTHFSGRYSKLPLVDTKYDGQPVSVAFDFMHVTLEQLPLLPTILPILRNVFHEDYEEMLIRTEKSNLRKSITATEQSV